MSERTKGVLRRMPAHFGATPGPRQGPDGRPFDWTRTPLRKTISLTFLSDWEALAPLLPTGLEPVNDPEVTLEVSYLSELEWLAGRGYNMFGVRFPARFQGRRDDVIGSFLSVLWENLPDPILSGRDELGFNKLFCEIPPPRVFRGSQAYEAHWLGHRFFEMEIGSIEEASAGEYAKAATRQRSDGMLHSKYVPRTGGAGVADIESITFTPGTGSKVVVDRVWKATGRHSFRPSTWEQLPTMFHIVNILGSLPVKKYLGAWVVETRGGKDLSDQRTLN